MHYHVVAFVNGCLNDYDSGPYESLEDARKELSEIVDADNAYELEQDSNLWEAEGVDRFTRRLHILKIEECHEDCEEE
jgi:hypothetical protein